MKEATVTDVAEDRKVCDLSVEELVALVRVPPVGTAENPALASMTVNQFAEMMLSYTKTASFAAASTERAVADRVLKDLEGLGLVKAVTLPCRVRNADDAAKLGKNMADTFAPGFSGELAVVVAVVQPSGEYAPFQKT